MRSVVPALLIVTLVAACSDSPTDIAIESPRSSPEPALFIVHGTVMADGAPLAGAVVEMIAGFNQGADPFSCDAPARWSVVATGSATSDGQGRFTRPLVLAPGDPRLANQSTVPFCLLTFTTPANQSANSPQHFAGQVFVAGRERSIDIELDVSHLLD